ncbi:MAG: hypothetical protein ACKPKO_07585, partial [Candidatus Fonsibacter sp.]
KIKDYGKYMWTKGSPERLKNIPNLPDELFEMIQGCPATNAHHHHHHHHERPKDRSGDPNNGERQQGVAGSQGSLLLPLHLPAGQLLHLDPSRHDL